VINLPRRRFSTIARRMSNRQAPAYGSYVGMYLTGTGYGVPRDGNRDPLRDAGRLDLNGIVRLCIDWYAKAITQAMFVTGKRITEGDDKGEYEPDESHPLTPILARPNPLMTYREVWSKVIAGIKIDGNAYCVIVRNNAGQPIELWWVPNHQMEIQASGDPRQPVAYYRVNALDGGSVDYHPTDVIHFRDYVDDHNPIMGMGVLKTFLDYVASLKRGGQFTNRALRRGNTGIAIMPPAGPGGVSYSMSDTEEAQMLAHKRRLDAGLDRDDGSPIIALTSFLEHTKIGFSPEEMTLDRILDRPEAYICAAMGLSPLLFDLPSSSASRTYSNKGEARKAAWEDSLVPVLGQISESLTQQLLYVTDPVTRKITGQFGDPEGMEVWSDTSNVPALQEDRSEKATYWIELVEAKLVTREYAASQLEIPDEAVPEDEPVPDPLAMAAGLNDEPTEEGDDADLDDEEDEPEPTDEDDEEAES
jgi:HK97 family phage portal protein